MVPVGAFHDGNVGVVRCLGSRLQGRVRRTEVSGDDDALFGLAVFRVEFHVDGTEDVVSRLELSGQARVAAMTVCRCL